MSENSVAVNLENVSKGNYGEGKVLGLEVQFSKMLGDVIIENYLKQLSEEDMKLIMDYISADLFEEVQDFKSDSKDAVKKRVKEDWTTHKAGSYSSYATETHKSVGSQIKELFNARVKEDLKQKIEEIVTTQDYKDKIDLMAQEIVDYATEGYKEDLKKSIREKMIGNIMDNNVSYGGQNLIDVVHSVVQSYLPRNDSRY